MFQAVKSGYFVVDCPYKEVFNEMDFKYMLRFGSLEYYAALSHTLKVTSTYYGICLS